MKLRCRCACHAAIRGRAPTGTTTDPRRLQRAGGPIKPRNHVLWACALCLQSCHMGGSQAPWFAHLVLSERVSCFVFPAFSNAPCVLDPLCSGFRPSCVPCFGPPVGLCSVLQPPPQHSARAPGPAPDIQTTVRGCPGLCRTALRHGPRRSGTMHVQNCTSRTARLELHA